MDTKSIEFADPLKRIAQYSVGLMIEVKDADGKGYFVAAGSGTLVRLAGEVLAIITASHVAKLVMTSPIAAMYGVPSPLPNNRPVEFFTELSDCIYFDEGEGSPDGPDIAIIKPQPDRARTLETSRVVYNVEKRVGLTPPAELPHIVLIGYPSTALSRLVSIEGNTRKDEHTLMVVSGTKSATVFGDDGFDRFEYTPNHADGNNPDTYQGVSGGGVWSFDAEDPAQLPYLIGVAFFQSPSLPTGRVISCAAPRAIYEKVLKAATAKWCN